MSVDDMFEVTTKVYETFQLADMAEILEIEAINSMSVSEPPLPTDSEEWTTYTEEEVIIDIRTLRMR